MTACQRSFGGSAAQYGNYNEGTCPRTRQSEFQDKVPEIHEPPITSATDRPTYRVTAPQITHAARRLLAEAHQLSGRGATVMDLILDHRLLITVADPRHRFILRRNCVPRCQADVDAYWARQKVESAFVSVATSKNIEGELSAERSTAAWTPNLDGDLVWDYDEASETGDGRPVL